MNKKGFFLLEFLLYLGLFSFISLVLMQFVVRTTLRLTTENAQINYFVKYSAALDALMYELQKAPTNAALWKEQSASAAVWPCVQDDLDKGFMLVGSKLIFYKGNYHQKKEDWGKKAQSLLADGIARVAFTYNQQNGVLKTITVALHADKEHGNYLLERTIGIHG